MRTVKQHYDELLGPVYSWILGDFDNAYAANVDLFRHLDVKPGGQLLAVDLGSGPGCQSIPLAELGWNVVAIDFCESLLDELCARAGDLPVVTACDDLLNFQEHAPGADLIVCMGDTLVHLPDRESVQQLIGRVAESLRPGGQFIATLRDYTVAAPAGADRFIPLRSSDEQIFTCFLEYLGDTINVHDILQEKVDGEWQLRISNYQKLLLDYRDVAKMLAAAGLAVDDISSADNMLVLRARKPA